MQAEKGKVYLVGSGPGGIELMTVKALRLLKSCDAIVYDHLAGDEWMSEVSDECELHFVGKQKGRHTLEQELIEELLKRLALEGKSVVRLKGGDPYIFGRGGEEAHALKQVNIPFEVVPGVTAALGCGAYAGIPMTYRKISTAVTFLSGHECQGKTEAGVDWEAYGATGGTLVIYMGMGNIGNIADSLISGGRDSRTPVAVIEWGCTNRQRKLLCDLETVSEKISQEEFGPPGLIVVGEVAGFSEQLDWFNHSLNRQS